VEIHHRLDGVGIPIFNGPDQALKSLVGILHTYLGKV